SIHDSRCAFALRMPARASLHALARRKSRRSRRPDPSPRPRSVWLSPPRAVPGADRTRRRQTIRVDAMQVGFVGWRGMVGSVLMQRMIAERDFDHLDPVFFSASRAGGKGPAIGKETPPLGSATDVAALKTMDAIVSCQGGDYTNDMHPKLRAAGWNGYWIDAASALRMADDAVIILDPVNRRVIDAALRDGIRDYIGSNCTVGLLMMALAGLLERDLIEWMTCMTYQAASGAGAQSMRELLSQMGEAHLAAKDLLADPSSSIRAIDREVAGLLRDEAFPTEHPTVPLAGSLIPWVDKDLGGGMSREEWKGGAALDQMLGREKNPIKVE